MRIAVRGRLYAFRRGLWMRDCAAPRFVFLVCLGEIEQRKRVDKNGNETEKRYSDAINR